MLYFFSQQFWSWGRTRRDGLWSGFAWTEFCCQSSVILWVKKYPNTTHPWTGHMELTLKSLEVIWPMMDDCSWIMEASIITWETLRKQCVCMITKLEHPRTWLSFILSHTWPSLQVGYFKMNRKLIMDELQTCCFVKRLITLSFFSQSSRYQYCDF